MVPEVSAQDVWQRLQSAVPFVLLDVREHSEVTQGAIANHLHIPLGELMAQARTKMPDLHQPVVAYCRSGVRSITAGMQLQEMGYTDVVSMAGGIIGWQMQGYGLVTPTSNNFSAAELQRYDRHLRLKEIGLAGQLNLQDSRVCCVGAGGLGSPALLYLAAAGVGTINIIDADQLDLSNLQRQILYKTSDVGLS